MRATLLLRCLKLILLFGACQQAKTAGADDAAILKQADLEQLLGHTADFETTFRDETGKEHPISAIVSGDKPVVLVLAYFECPHLCGLVLKDLPQALAATPFELGEDYEVVTVSIEPSDTPADARAAEKRYLANTALRDRASAWHFLTGTTDSVAALAESVGFKFAYDPKIGEYSHAAGVMVLTAGATLSRYLYGVKFSPNDLRLALMDAGQGSIGSVVDKVLLRCYQYDPQKGEYSLAVMNILRAGGGVTALVIFGFLLRSWRQETS